MASRGPLDPERALAQTLSASRYLSAALIGEMLEDAYGHRELLSHPTSRLTRSASPLFMSKDGDLWLGYRYFSEDAYIWARRHASKAAHLRTLYIADTKYQFRTDLPEGAHVQSASAFDRDMLEGRYAEQIRVLQRRVELCGKWRHIFGIEVIPQTIFAADHSHRDWRVIPATYSRLDRQIVLYSPLKLRDGIFKAPVWHWRHSS
jgi:hypothetical protein